MRNSSQDLKSRLPSQPRELSEEAQAIFYSNWQHAAVSLLTGIPNFDTVDQIAAFFGFSRTQAQKILSFLLSNGMCIEENGKVRMGLNRTHLAADSPLIARHHTNWRLKGIHELEAISNQELFYTCPMVLSRESILKIRRELVSLIEKVQKIVDPSPNEALACLNIDWFELKNQVSR